MKKNLLVFFSFITIFLSFFAGKVFAADAFPPPGKIPCTDTKYPEFSSDRPYQASPCGDAPQALFCGNTVVIDLGSVSCPWPGGSATSCKPAVVHHDQSIDVDLTDVQLPILGNTQLTVNSQSSADQIDDGAKVSNYVAWYLSGTNDKAEYPRTDATTPEGSSEVVNTTGPVKKLLPSAIQDAQRIDTIITASKKEPSYLDPETNQTINNEPQNHNQVVVCAKDGVAVPCYSEGGKVYRLKDWDDGGLSLLNNFFNFLGADIWNNRYPPLPWQFSKDVFYQKAYNEWRGATCIILPFVDVLVCGRIPFVSPSTEWSVLYPYVPLANTTDKKGAQMVTNTHLEAPKATLENTSYEIIHSPQLYLAHSLEDYTLSNLLKTTYKSGTASGEVTPDSSIPLDVENNYPACRIIPSRSNPGDDATFSTPKSHIVVNVHYDVTEIQCSTPEWVCHTVQQPPPLPPREECKWVSHCESDVTATIPSLSKTPYADEIWQNTVAGNDSIFRRIYPKTGEGSPVSCIADTPAESAAKYTIDKGGSSPGIGLIRVNEPDGSPVTGSADSIDAKLYFPHYGGVLDYFLNGIQTALRPQGFGQPTPKDGNYCVPLVGTGDCKQWLFMKDGSGKYYYDKIIAAAASASCNGKSLNPFWAIGIALNENGGLMTDTVDGSSNSHFGCNISQVQSIEEKTSCMINTLLNDCLAGKTDEQTLAEYGYAPGYVLYPITVLAFGSPYPPPLFGGGFNTSQLLFNLLHTNWAAVYGPQAPTFCPNSPTLVPPPYP